MKKVGEVENLGLEKDTIRGMRTTQKDMTKNKNIFVFYTLPQEETITVQEEIPT